MRIVPEGTMGAWWAECILSWIGFLTPRRPGDNPNDCAQMYSCPNPTVTFDNFNPIPNFYVDVGSGGPASFTFTAASNASWLTLSPAKGSISSTAPEQRVFASVKDWSKLSSGDNTAVITFTATASGQPDLSVPVTFVATKNTLPSEFKGEFDCTYWWIGPLIPALIKALLREVESSLSKQHTRHERQQYKALLGANFLDLGKQCQPLHHYPFLIQLSPLERVPWRKKLPFLKHLSRWPPIWTENTISSFSTLMVAMSLLTS